MKQTKTIGIFHYQVGATDGVSLEIEKWKTVLEKLGHKVLLCAGYLGDQEGILIPELFHHHPEIMLINQSLMGENKKIKPDALDGLFSRFTHSLEETIRKVILENSMDLFLINNIWSVALNLPAAVALETVRRDLDLPAIAHHHDFFWERIDNLDRCHPKFREIADQYLPPQSPKIKHVVINSMAQSELKERKDIDASIVPNIFDFSGPDWVIDDYNNDLRQAIGLKDNDIYILQATRIIPRKGIELAIDLVGLLDESRRREKLQRRGLYDGRVFNHDSNIVLVLAGYDRDDPTGEYLKNLKKKADNSGVDLRHIDKIIGPSRVRQEGSKIYSLWDAYTVADLVTYPSLWEGWGNQLLEGLRAKLPMVIFEYPVYIRDIKSKSFDVISLGSKVISRDRDNLVHIPEEVLQCAADQCIDLLTNRTLREDVIKRNFHIAKQNYSFKRLSGYLRKLV